MKIAYIHQHYVDARTTGGGTRSWEWARRLAARQHDVEIWTGTGERRTETVLLDDTHFQVRSWGIGYANGFSRLQRLWSFAKFTIMATIRILYCPKPDLVIATSTPLTVAVPALVGRKLRGIPYLFEVRDQWPAVPIEMGLMPKVPLFARLALWLEKSAYRNASGIVALSPGMSDGVSEVLGGSAEVDLTVVPNASDLELFERCLDAPKDPTEAITVLYAGTLGAANDVPFIAQLIGAMDQRALDSRLQNRYRFVVIGDGKYRSVLESVKCRSGTVTLELLDPVAKSEVVSLYAQADIALATFSAFEILEHNSANKFFDALAAGRPIALNYGGWQRSLIEEAEAGLWLGRSDIAAAARDLDWYCRTGATEQGGINAHRLAREQFSRDSLFETWLGAVERAAGVAPTNDQQLSADGSPRSRPLSVGGKAQSAGH